MNTIKYIPFLLLFIVIGCWDDTPLDVIPKDAPRLNELSETYTKALSAPEKGWKAMYQPIDNSMIINIIMNFNEDGTMTVESDINGFHEKQENVRYRVGGTVFPELVFETYCVFHHIYDVALGDFEFRILSADENEIKLGYYYDTSNYTALTLTKALQVDFDILQESQQTAQWLQSFSDNSEAFFFNLKIEGNQNFEAVIDMDLNTNTLYFTYINNQEVYNIETAYYYFGNALVFPNAWELPNGQSIKNLQFSGLTENNVLQISEAGKGNTGQITASHKAPFEFIGANTDLLKTDVWVLNYQSPQIDSLINQVAPQNDFVFFVFYVDTTESGTKEANNITFFYYDENDNPIRYEFYLKSYLATGEDNLRLVWDGTYSDNVKPKLIKEIKPLLYFLLDSNGFTLMPMSKNYYAFISKDNSQKYFTMYAYQ